MDITRFEQQLKNGSLEILYEENNKIVKYIVTSLMQLYVSDRFLEINHGYKIDPSDDYAIFCENYEELKKRHKRDDDHESILKMIAERIPPEGICGEGHYFEVYRKVHCFLNIDRIVKINVLHCKKLPDMRDIKVYDEEGNFLMEIN